MRASFGRGKTVVETGEPANCFYLLISGSLGLETPGARIPLQVQTVGPGEILGWSWLFPPDCWHFDAIAAEPTETIFFHGSRLRQECERDQTLCYELFTRMAQRHSVCKETLMTAGGIGTAFLLPNSNCERNSLLSLEGGNLNTFALKTDPDESLQRVPEHSANWWPHVLLDTAKVAIKWMSGARKSPGTEEPYTLLTPAIRPPVSSSESQS